MPVRLGGFYELRSITKRQFAVLLNGALLTAHRSASALTLAESMSNSTSAELAYLLRSTAVISPLTCLFAACFLVLRLASERPQAKPLAKIDKIR